MKTLSYEEQIELVEKISEVDDFYETDIYKFFEDYKYIYCDDEEEYSDKKEASLCIYDKYGNEYFFERVGFKEYSYGSYIRDIWYDWDVV